jgi:hypothetical protein
MTKVGDREINEKMRVNAYGAPLGAGETVLSKQNQIRSRM